MEGVSKAVTPEMVLDRDRQSQREKNYLRGRAKCSRGAGSRRPGPNDDTTGHRTRKTDGDFVAGMMTEFGTVNFAYDRIANVRVARVVAYL